MIGNNVQCVANQCQLDRINKVQTNRNPLNVGPSPYWTSLLMSPSAKYSAYAVANLLARGPHESQSTGTLVWPAGRMGRSWLNRSALHALWSYYAGCVSNNVLIMRSVGLCSRYWPTLSIIRSGRNNAHSTADRWHWFAIELYYIMIFINFFLIKLDRNDDIFNFFNFFNPFTIKYGLND